MDKDLKSMVEEEQRHIYGKFFLFQEREFCICYTHFLHKDTNERTDTHPVLSPPEALNMGAFQKSGQPQICNETQEQRGIQQQSQAQPAYTPNSHFHIREMKQ